MTRWAPFALFLALLTAGCGGSTSAGGSSPTSTAPEQPTTTAPLGKPNPPFKLKVVASGHTAKAGQLWNYTITATGLDGKPVGGTAKPVVFEGETRLDGIGWLGFTGKLEKTYTWNPDWRGKRLIFRVEVDANNGAEYVDYPVRVT